MRWLVCCGSLRRPCCCTFEAVLLFCADVQGLPGNLPSWAVYSFPRAVVTKTRKPSCLKEQQFWGLEVQDQAVSGPGSLTLLRESFLASYSLLVAAGNLWAPLQLHRSIHCLHRHKAFSPCVCLHVAIFSQGHQSE